MTTLQNRKLADSKFRSYVSVKLPSDIIELDTRINIIFDNLFDNDEYEENVGYRKTNTVTLNYYAYTLGGLSLEYSYLTTPDGAQLSGESYNLIVNDDDRLLLCYQYRSETILGYATSQESADQLLTLLRLSL